MRTGTWVRLLAENRFRIHPLRLPMALGISLACPVNEALWLLQQCLHGRRLRETTLAAPPIFILGHWRSGTTLMHELIDIDPRLGCPSTFQCFAPHHFIVSEWVFRRFFNWLMPRKRPMDNMAAGWERPQEDEFALMNLGGRSPYRRIAFPNQPPPDLKYLDWETVTESEEKHWLATLDWFLRAVTLQTDRRLVLKSPTHTGRIGVLARYFPGSKFIHMTRDPRSLFPSTCRLWQGLDEVQSLQRPAVDRLEGYVVECLQRIYRGFHRDVDSLPDDRIIHVRYEDLVADPVAQLDRVYQQLNLEHFATVRPALQTWVESQHRQYETNRHCLSPEMETRLQSDWAEYFRRYGY